ncbi:MAG: nitrite/sulfite reductase [Candidatus Gastranaerophilales bacterium]|nr:nitrite/sulfite reductase [Candidatus Gastranaerophilales bacterium]
MKIIEPQAIKLFGSYPQRQEGLFMQRVPVFAGEINIGQLKSLAELAIRYTPTTPLHLTTRQNIEFHNVREADQMSLHSDLKSLGFNTFGAGGDSVRNITICPCCKYNPAALDPRPLAEKVKQVLDDSGLLTSMGRKFKLAFSGCPTPQSKPYITDFAVVVTGKAQAKVIGAGSLGPSPQAGIVLYEDLPIGQVPALALAALRLFVDHGDRDNRRKARLRHIRQRIGDESFRNLLAEYFTRAVKELGIQNIELSYGRSDLHKVGTFQAVAGNLASDELLLLCETAEQAQAQLQINLQHGIEIYAPGAIDIPDSLKPYLHLPVIIACPGSTTCKNGIVNAPAMATELSDKLRTDQRFLARTIAISGCPNNCMHSCASEIGLIGRTKTIDGTRHEAYTILMGGDNGSSPKFAQQTDIALACELAEKLKALNL